LRLPPLPEQQRIAYILSTVQTAIEQQARLIKLTCELKSALMHKLFTEGLHGEKQKMTEIGPVPESWEVVKFGDIAELRKEIANPNSSLEEIYIGLEHIEPTKFWWSNNGHPSEVRSAKNIFYSGDILYGKLRPYLDKAVIATTTGICSTDILVFTPKKGITSNFLVSILHTRKLLAYAIMTTSGVNHPRTSWDSLKGYRFGLPQEKERNELAQIMTTLETKILDVEKKQLILKELFRTLLHQLMTGQTRVNDIDLPGLS
jgi:Restriction endonuclease S subunits